MMFFFSVIEKIRKYWKNNRWIIFLLSGNRKVVLLFERVFGILSYVKKGKRKQICQIRSD